MYGLAMFAVSLPLAATIALKLNPRCRLVGDSVLVCSAVIWRSRSVSGCVASRRSRVRQRFTMGGSSTPYKEQYSREQALVMRGEVDEALRSFEAVLAEKPDAIDPRIKAAELYAKEKGDHRRAAELFREVQRIAPITPGEDVYATNRLVDLYTGPLGRSRPRARRATPAHRTIPGLRRGDSRPRLRSLRSNLACTPTS